MTDDDTALGTALHDRVRDEHPDLDQLIRVSTRAGTRLRKRRTVAAALGGALAAAAIVGVVGASLGGGGAPGVTPEVATQPAATASASTRADELEKLASEAGTQALRLSTQQLPIHVAPSLQGWEIGIAADDKFPASKGSSSISVNVRPKSELAAWSGNDPDRPASQVVHTGDNYFVTVQPNPDVPQAVVDELVDALRYQPRWKQ